MPLLVTHKLLYFWHLPAPMLPVKTKVLIILFCLSSSSSKSKSFRAGYRPIPFCQAILRKYLSSSIVSILTLLNSSALSREKANLALGNFLNPSCSSVKETSSFCIKSFRFMLTRNKVPRIKIK